MMGELVMEALATLDEPMAKAARAEGIPLIGT